jgi:hypothetical protein
MPFIVKNVVHVTISEYNVIPAFEESKYNNQATAEEEFKKDVKAIAWWKEANNLNEWARKQVHSFEVSYCSTQPKKSVFN